jgi:hypothetical protein
MTGGMSKLLVVKTLNTPIARTDYKFGDMVDFLQVDIGLVRNKQKIINFNLKFSTFYQDMQFFQFSGFTCYISGTYNLCGNC